MRELTTLTDSNQAAQLVAYLLTQGIPATADEDDDEIIVWVHNDDDRETADRILQEFSASPDDPKYSSALKQAQQIRREERGRVRRVQKNYRDLSGRWSGVWWKAHPACYLLIGICVLVAVACTDWGRARAQGRFPRLCGNDDSPVYQALLITQVDFSNERNGRIPYTPLPEVLLEEYQVWRLFTPALLHFGLLHILFNMMWIRSLGCAVEFVRGTRRFLGVVLITGVVSNVAQYYSDIAIAAVLPAFAPEPQPCIFFGGMSGVVFGLIGYVWWKGRTQPEHGIALREETVIYSFAWLFICMTGAIGPIANTAHAVGLLTGSLIGGRRAILRRIRRLVKT